MPYEYDPKAYMTRLLQTVAARNKEPKEDRFKAEAGTTATPKIPLVASQGLAYILKDDGTYEVSGIGTCQDTNLVIPNEYDGKPVTSIGNQAFDECNSLTTLIIGENVMNIGDHAFRDCKSLTTVTFSDSVVNIGDSTFSGCSSLTSVALPDSMKSIGDYAFYACSSLTSVIIGGGMKYIGNGAFWLCSNLTSVAIGGSVTIIGYVAFYSCSSLIDIYYAGTQAEWNAITKYGDWDLDTPYYIVHFNC